MAVKVKQGDAYSIPVIVKIDGDPINIADVSEVEFMLNGVRKMYPDSVSYDAVENAFMLPITQEESFAFPVGSVMLDVRVKFNGGNVEGIHRIVSITVIDAISEEVI